MILLTVWFVFLLRLTYTDCYGKQGKESVKQGCKLEGLHPHLIVTYKNITISVDKITILHAERLTIRCSELGRYKLIGDSLLQCHNGVWNGVLPSCIPTTAISNYTEDVPPTILFGLPLGFAAIEPSGALAVFPNSILHLECLFARILGNPEWTWNSTNRQHLTGWAIAASERDIKYRLSIYYAKDQDSGIYTCSTPKGLTNSIRVNVVDVLCPTLPFPAPPLIAKIDGARMGQTANFECPSGYRLEGISSMTCQYNGKWSAEIPHCEAIVCPPIEPLTNPKLQLLEYNNSFGGKVVFTCMWGSRLLGPQSIKCDENGVWNDSLPNCIEIVCPPPTVPRNGIEINFSSKKKDQMYKVGFVVRFACLHGYQLLGEASVICTENGTWSHQPPVCDTRCPYPGDPTHGQIAPLKFWYKPGDNIQVTCAPGYVTPLEPVKKPTCRESGVWSGPPPPCRSYKDV